MGHIAQLSEHVLSEHVLSEHVLFSDPIWISQFIYRLLSKFVK